MLVKWFVPLDSPLKLALKWCKNHQKRPNITHFTSILLPLLRKWPYYDFFLRSGTIIVPGRISKSGISSPDFGNTEIPDFEILPGFLEKMGFFSSKNCTTYWKIAQIHQAMLNKISKTTRKKVGAFMSHEVLYYNLI